MPFDLDAVLVEPKKAAKTKQFTFTFDGDEYTLITPADSINLDLLALNAANRGDYVNALMRLMSPDEYARIVRSSKTFTGEAILSLLDAYYKHTAAMDTGESAASSNSSKSTARPSKRTSKSTTGSRSRT